MDVDMKKKTDEESAGECSEEQSSPDASPGKRSAPLEDMEGRLDELQLQDPAEFIRSLPAPVKRRVKALKKLQVKHFEIESQFYQEIHELEAKFAAKFAPVFEKRQNIVSGELEPTDSDCDWESDNEEEEAPEAGDTKVNNSVNSPDVKGMPDFWLRVLKNCGDVSELIREHDEPILKHLNDIKLILSPAGQPISFTIEFHFGENSYFVNNVITKKYFLKMEPDSNDLMYEGPEIHKCEGCPIEWKEGKNVTVKTIKKKQKHKKTGTMRSITKQVQNDSFFNFFSPPSLEEQEEENEETEAVLQQDFELGHFFREQLIPRALLYYTGDAIEMESSDEDFDEDTDSDEEDSEGDGAPRPHGRGGKRALSNGDDKKDCKQQQMKMNECQWQSK